MYFTPYIDGNGVHIPSYEDRMEALVASYRNIFGPDVNLEISSPDYQLLSVFAKALDDLSQIVLVDFASRNPQYASGVGLDLLMPLHGLVRGGATYSTVVLTLNGTPNAVLPDAPEALDDAGYIWRCQTAGIQLDENGQAIVTAICTTPGAIPAAAGTVRQLVSPISGLSSVVNAAAATPGTEAETDASCRNRLKAAAAASAIGSLDAIRYGVLSVPNVNACTIIENNGDTEDERGIPGHSICVLFAGGNAYSVAQMVFDKKAPGIGTYGNLELPVNDAWGNAHTVKLQRITNANVALTIEIRPLAGYDTTIPERIREALVEYAGTLSVGQDLVVSSLYPVIYGAVETAVPAFSVNLLTATYGGTTTSGILTANWNQKFNIRAAQVQIVEVN
ncbi:MAG: baseplate J/gp47 family protein [Clostridia bacterium]|nr:baseplate J/gp47 family protein [Clostridia bacterium]